MKKHRLCLLGATGFVGHHLVTRLAREGHPLRVLTRRRERSRDLLVFPTLELIQTDVHYVSDLTEHFKGCDAVINLVGTLHGEKAPEHGMEAVHVELPRKVVEAARFNGIARVLHMSALNADPNGPSEYLRTKGRGEDVVHESTREGMRVTSFRPSVIFGPGDHFFNRFSALLRLSPILPLACPDARFAPVFAGDVAEAFVKSLDDKTSFGQRLELCGPQTLTLRELVRYTARTVGLRRLVVGLGDSASRLQARLLEFAPGKPFTRDNYLSMQVDSVCRSDGLQRLGITPTGIDAVVPAYLGATNKASYLSGLRGLGGRG